MKISFIGAGSVHFTTAVVHDITTYSALDAAEICLMDIDAYRLKKITECVERIKKEMNSNIRIIATTDREAALTGADAVICTVFNGDVDIWQHEILIPKIHEVFRGFFVHYATFLFLLIFAAILNASARMLSCLIIQIR